MIPRNILDKIVDIKLQDDDTPYGGISFAGETVLDFLFSIDECDVKNMNTVDDLNLALKECGIKPIKI